MFSQWLAELSWSVKLILIAVVGYVALTAYWKATLGVCISKKKLNGMTVVVTGANTGIGKETALDLAHRGARVILACRDMKKATAAKDDIINQSGNRDVVVRHLDTSSLESVRKFANELIQSEQRLDILINNAGCAALEKKILTDDGLEYQMAANYFGHFLLTNMLLGLLKRTNGSRIVNVSSLAHTHSKDFNFENLNSELSYDPWEAYSRTKLSQVLFTRYFAQKLKDTDVTINSLHPGLVKTEVFRHCGILTSIILNILPFTKTVKEGAQTTIHLAVSEEVKGVTGKYFSDCQVRAQSLTPTSELGNVPCHVHHLFFHGARR